MDHNKPFQTIHYVYGMDVSTMTKATLLDCLRRAEKDRESLKKIETKSAYIAAEIGKLDEAIGEIVKELDKEAKKGA